MQATRQALLALCCLLAATACAHGGSAKHASNGSGVEGTTHRHSRSHSHKVQMLTHLQLKRHGVNHECSSALPLLVKLGRHSGAIRTWTILSSCTAASGQVLNSPAYTWSVVEGLMEVFPMARDC